MPAREKAMTGEEMIRFVEDLYAATGRGDWEAAEAMLTDDFFITEAAGLPMAGTYSGRGALRELYTRVFSLLEVSALDRLQTLTGEDCAITVLRMHFAGEGKAPAELCEMFRFRNGKCCEIKPFYFDPAPVVAAAR